MTAVTSIHNMMRRLFDLFLFYYDSLVISTLFISPPRGVIVVTIHFIPQEYSLLLAGSVHRNIMLHAKCSIWFMYINGPVMCLQTATITLCSRTCIYFCYFTQLNCQQRVGALLLIRVLYLLILYGNVLETASAEGYVIYMREILLHAVCINVTRYK